MQLLISICYPDGRPPDQGARMINLDYDGWEAQDILDQLEEDDKALVHFPSGKMLCIHIATYEEYDKLFGGKYIHAVVREEGFEKIPEMIARLH